MAYTYTGEFNNYVPFEAGSAHFDSIIAHIQRVQDIGARIGVQPNLLKSHDASKFSMFEFPIYAKHFFGGGDEHFVVALNHHYRANPHHWNHWVLHHDFPRSLCEKGFEHGIVSNMALEMPHPYADEMLADWMAMSLEKTGEVDITDWLNANRDDMLLHELTWDYIFSRAKELGIYA